MEITAKVTVEYRVPSTVWEDYVDAFSKSSGVKPDRSKPKTAGFVVNKDLSLDIISDESSQLIADKSIFVGVKSDKTVKDLAKFFKLEEVDIQVTTTKDTKPDKYTINMARIKIPTSEAAPDEPTQDAPGSTDTTSDVPATSRASALEGGVIHNPPQVNLMQQSSPNESVSDQ